MCSQVLADSSQNIADNDSLIAEMENVYEDSFECESDIIIQKLKEKLKEKDQIIALNIQKIKELEHINVKLKIGLADNVLAVSS